jgi:glutaminyl-peptide cyclotransferase
MNKLAVLSVFLLVAGAMAGQIAAQPIINNGEAPQVGHERVYGQSEVPVFTYEILATYPHDTADYTEALFMHDGHLYEGTGLYGESRLKIWDLETGEVIRQHDLDDRYFGEGAIVLGDRLYQVTYISNTGFVYDPETLEQELSFRFPRQGWGMTTDGDSLIMGDGSSGIYFLNPINLYLERYITVEDGFGSVGFLNELEYVDGEIYANIWQTDYIVRFSAETGKVTGWVDLTGLNPDPERLRYPLVLNGIAAMDEPGTLLVTGKKWPHLWRIRLVPAETQ